MAIGQQVSVPSPLQIRHLPWHLVHTVKSSLCDSSTQGLHDRIRIYTAPNHHASTVVRTSSRTLTQHRPEKERLIAVIGHWGLNGEEGSHDNAFRTTAIVLDRSQILSPRGCKVDNEVLPASDLHHHSNLKVPYRKVRNHISCPLFHSSDFTSASSIARRVCRTSLRC